MLSMLGLQLQTKPMSSLIGSRRICISRASGPKKCIMSPVPRMGTLSGLELDTGPLRSRSGSRYQIPGILEQVASFKCLAYQPELYFRIWCWRHDECAATCQLVHISATWRQSKFKYASWHNYGHVLKHIIATFWFRWGAFCDRGCSTLRHSLS